MKKLTGFYALIFLFFFSYKGQVCAQTTAILSLDSAISYFFITSINDTIIIQGKLSAHDTLGQNISYQGTVDFWMISDSMASTLVSPRNFFSAPYSIDTTGLWVSLPLDIRPDEMRSGPNVIIVWPGYATHDTNMRDALTINAEVNGYLNLPEITDPERPPYPNPTPDELYLVPLEQEQLTISIYDLYGKQLKNIVLQPNGHPIKLSLLELPAGAYTLQISNKKGQSTHYKILKK